MSAFEIADPPPLLDWRAVSELVERTVRALEADRVRERARRR